MSRFHPSDPCRRRDLCVGFLCLFAVLNPLIVQVSFFLFPERAPGALSGPQLFQGVAFLIGVFIVLRVRWIPTVQTARTGRFLLLAVLGTAVFLSKSALQCDQFADIAGLRPDVVFCFKIVFWSASWFLITILIRREEDARCLLRALVCGATVTAVIALVCYATGAGTIAVYARQGVRASVGASGVSAKQTVAYLAPCAFVAIYLGRTRRRALSVIVAMILLSSVLLSYDRAVQVGFVAAVLWLVVWWVLHSGRRNRPLVNRRMVVGALLVLVLAGGLLYPSLRTRWTADFAQGRPGSGRIEFYGAALRAFTSGSLADAVMGIGYSGVTRTMQERCGLSVHTHSDLFDLLLGGGLLGLGIYMAFFGVLLSTLREVAASSAEWALMGAACAIVAVMGLITGLLEATHAMFCLGAILHCCSVLAPAGTRVMRNEDEAIPVGSVDTSRAGVPGRGGISRD